MPSRSNNTTKKSKPVKEETTEQDGSSSKPTKQKPKVKTTSKSSPEDQLRASWEFLSLYQFFSTFSSFFRIPSYFSIEKLEQALLNDDDRSCPESSISSNSSHNNSQFLAEFIILVITPLLTPVQQNRIKVDDYEEYLFKIFPQSRVRFSRMKPMERVKLLKVIENLYMETGNESFTAYKNDNAAESLRADSLGVDSEGWTYWFFGESRLYREVPIPNGKRGVDMMNSTDFTFELVCSTIEEWHAVIQKFTPNKSSLAKKICGLGTEVIATLENRETVRLRNINKMKRAKELELVPKKRSRRLETKLEEKAKIQEMMDIEKQQAEYKEFERKKKLKDEKAALEQEKRDMKVEEARLKNEIHDYVQGLISNKFETDINLKELKNQMSSKATENDYVVKMQGWISLLSDNVMLQVKEGNKVSFTGDNLNEALEFNLLKNTLRTYITTLLKFNVENDDTEMQSKLNQIYKNILLKRYGHIDTFCFELDNALAASSIQQNAIDLLAKIFKK